MLRLSDLTFLSPWILYSLAILPALWWLLRVTPPAPLVKSFPPLRFLLALRPQEETPAQTPFWLLLLRIFIALLVIVGLAHPIWNPGERLYGQGPLILVIDNGWASAPQWDKRMATMMALVDQAERDSRPIRYITTAQPHPTEPLRISNLLRPSVARDKLRSLRPQPWNTNREKVSVAMTSAKSNESAHVAWLSDGIDGPGVKHLLQQLQQFGALTLYRQNNGTYANLIQTPVSTIEGISVPLLRPDQRGEAERWLRLIDLDGRLLNRKKVIFEDGKKISTAVFHIPVDIRNRAAHIAIEEEKGAGAIFLMDNRWRRRPVGIASGNLAENNQPLLSDDYYLIRALEPFSDLQLGPVKSLLQNKLAMIVLADIGKLSNAEIEGLSNWMDKGGVLLRFAGPQMAQGTDTLVPVRLRGGRVLGGTMSWSSPAKLLPFDDKGPFAGLKIPNDIRIHRQILAHPTMDLNRKSWVRLADGTPLITADRRGAGWIVLVHTTANTEWSNLPISGLFIEILRRISGLSQGIAGDGGNTIYPPLATMNGFGVLGSPPATAVAITGRDFPTAMPGPKNPPGYYGRGDARRSLNLSTGVKDLSIISGVPSGVSLKTYSLEGAFNIKPWLLLAAIILALTDLTVSYVIRGLDLRLKSETAKRITNLLIVAVTVTVAFSTTGVAQAQISNDPKEAFAIRATLETHLAYVITGDRRVDRISHAGMLGLSSLLRHRTAVEPGAPIAVNIERDQLAFFPIIYWPISKSQRRLSNQAVEKLNAYLRTGGNILFDTREQSTLAFDPFGVGGAGAANLRRLLIDLDIPAVSPVPADHVLTRSFYLLKQFHGRWTGGTVWVERRGGRHNDGVSSIIMGSNDWAGAWAVNSDGVAMFPVVPGGERQRELAYRFGVNWIMYCLTGNYKTDQVHLPAIIERLGQ